MSQWTTPMPENGAASQPASAQPLRSYCFGPGWRITRFVAGRMWMEARMVRERWIDHAATVRYATLDSFFVIRGWAWLVIAGLYAAAWLQYLPVVALVALFSLAHAALLCLCVASALPGIGALSLLDAFATRARGGSALYCPSCYRAIAAPAYLCPLCQTMHAPALRPNTCGVLWHRCHACRARLATLDLFGRRRLARICPHCRAALPAGSCGERSVHIALVGGASAGKTSYLAMELHALQQRYVNTRRYTIAMLDAEQEMHCERCRRLLQGKEALPATTTFTPRAYTLRMQAMQSRKPQLAYIYDPAGEAFRSSARVEEQAYYRLCDGIIFVIDPLTIPAFYQRHASVIARIQPELCPPGLHLVQTYERMMQALETRGALARGRRSPIVFMVVVTRIDRLDLADEIGLPAAITLMSRDPTIPGMEDALHRLTRAFLCTHGMEHIVRDIEAHFARVRYCSYSATEPALASRGATAPGPLAWLLEQCGALTP